MGKIYASKEELKHALTENAVKNPIAAEFGTERVYVQTLKQRMGTRLSPEQYVSVADYIAAASYNTVFTVIKMSQLLKLDYVLVQEVLNILVEIGTLKNELCLRCPKCHILIENVDDITNIEKEVFCYGCENDIEIENNDVENIYSLRRPIADGE
jgi:hypothetical protein